MCPPILGLSGSLRATDSDVHGHNIVQAAIDEFPGVYWHTVSRAIKAWMKTLPRTLDESAAHDRGVPKDCDFRGGWHPPPLLGLDRRDLWSGECRTTGANVQILVLLDGGFARAPGLYPELCMTWPPRAPSGLLEELDLSGADR